MKNRTIEVKGTKYYKAMEAFKDKTLIDGAGILLARQPDNPYDEHAVAVYLKQTGVMLGHIPRENAMEYSRLINANRIVDCCVSQVSIDERCVILKVRISYNDIDNEVKQSLFWKSALSLPFTSGVYSIICNVDGRTYVGSSRNIRTRLFSHIKELEFGTHQNHLLQQDYIDYGPEEFRAAIIEKSGYALLLTKEAEVIQQLLKRSVPLYNMTIDGQGVSTFNNSHDHEDIMSISDRFDYSNIVEEFNNIKQKTSPSNPTVYTPPKKAGCLTIAILMIMVLAASLLWIS